MLGNMNRRDHLDGFPLWALATAIVVVAVLAFAYAWETI